MISPHGAKEVLITAAALGAGAAGLSWLWPGAWPWFAVPAVVLALAVALFFRDPERAAPDEPRALVSPADGKVVEIAETEDPEFIVGPAHKIAIFMSLTDVHVNRSPCAGRVESVQHRPGQFLNALRAEASAHNEANLIGLRNAETGAPVLLKQIAGLVARRVVCAAKPGDDLARGERIGVVKFGSRAEVYVPADDRFAWRVRLGEKVKAGSTVLGAWSE